MSLETRKNFATYRLRPETKLSVSRFSDSHLTVAYGEKYNTKATRKWVKGFGTPARELATLELVRR